jgi:SAM-dependent methyltransferase
MKPGIQRIARWLRYNAMYLGKPPWDTGETPPEVNEFIRQHPPGRAIDLGCGTGTNLLTLGQAGWLVTGVDFAIQAVAKARRKLEEAGIPGEVRSGDVSRYETVRGAYDLALDIGCYHGLSTSMRGSYRANLCRILKPGGWYLLYAHWKQAGDKGTIGITQSDFEAISKLLTLETREDSLDRRGHSAVWMLFSNQSPPEEDMLE